MFNTNKEVEDLSMSRKVTSTSENRSSVVALKPSMLKSQSYGPGGDKANITPPLTHNQIEERAKAIWRQKGCPVGQDEKNWYEAEAQLRKEFATK